MRGYACIGLWEPKFADNLGHVMRASGCYGVDMVAYTGDRMTKTGVTDTQKAYRHIPLINAKDLRDILPMDCVPVAVDLLPRAKPLPDYVHPERALYVFGGEDRTLNEDIVAWCRDVIYVPTRFCMNLSACVNVILYDRMMKQLTRNERGLSNGKMQSGDNS